MVQVQRVADLPLGSKIKMGKFKFKGDTPIIWRVVSNNHWEKDSNYPLNSVTLITDEIIHQMARDGKEPDNALTDRAAYGNNRYRLSNIRQWLNTNLGANNWYYPQNIKGEFHWNDRDTPPDNTHIVLDLRQYPYADLQGFASMFKEYEQNLILPTKVKTGTHPEYDYSPTIGNENGSFDLTEDKFFLPSITELGFGTNIYQEINPNEGVEEGALIDYFADVENRKSTMTDSCYELSKYSTWTFASMGYTADSNNYQYMTRSSHLDSSSRFYLATDVATIASASNDTYSIRPMCNVTADTLVSTTPDEDGIYYIIANVAPTVEIDSIDVLDVKFNIFDMNGFATEVKVYFNGDLLNTFTTNLSNELSVTIPYNAINPTSNELIFITKDNDNLEGTQTFKLDFKKELIKPGNTVSGRNETFIVNDLVDNNDGTASLIVNRNLKYRINSDRPIEKLEFKFKPFVHITEDYHSTPSYEPMKFNSVEYDFDKNEATEAWETSAEGVYAKSQIQINRSSIHDEIALKKVSQIFKYKEEM
ncbi:DUF6273 domain-containing protein [Psychrobacillus sp. BM2]|uniref:DUF6273 domain-containing protein n=1 Tax=Psychrobacillus sp. BM2 TaxID=3400421 RepID=UPI003B012258